MSIQPEICVYGAGSIGCYIGGRLAATGSKVRFVGRPRLAGELRQHGLRLTDFRGADLAVPAERIRFETTPAGAADADLVLVCVKSAGTEQAGRELGAVLKPGALVVSFQNGVRNPEMLRQQLPGRPVLAGMVPFNVLSRGRGAFHQGTSAGLMIEGHKGLEAFAPAFAAAGLPFAQRHDMREVLWGKLLINLNNPVNALAGVPLREVLGQRAYRRCWALAQLELLALLKTAGIRPARATPLPPRLLPYLLGVPDALFLKLAGRMVRVDPLARLSLAQDFEAGRLTEIDWINGEVVRLAQQLGRRAPVNEKLVALIHTAEAGGRRQWAGTELLAELQSA